MYIPTYVIIPTHNRHDKVVRLVTSCHQSIDHAFIIDNASNPPLSDANFHHYTCEISIIYDAEQPPNLYRLWNIGLAASAHAASLHYYDKWNVAILNDDAIISTTWIDVVSRGLRRNDVVAASTRTIGVAKADRIIHDICVGDYRERMCPWAFMLRGESHLRADEDFRWWYGDNDLDWRARTKGGLLLAAGPYVVNECANQTTVGDLMVQAGHDAETFQRKWNRLP